MNAAFEPTNTALKGVVSGKIQTDLERKPRAVCFFNNGQAAMVGMFDGVM
jgi:hypothetical protein